MQVVRPTDAQPGVAARPAQAANRMSAQPIAVQPAVLDLTLRREAVPLTSVQSTRVAMGGLPIGYIRLDTFTNTSGADVQRAVQSLSKQGVKGFVLDLRDNPGGILEAGAPTPSLSADAAQLAVVVPNAKRVSGSMLCVVSLLLDVSEQRGSSKAQSGAWLASVLAMPCMHASKWLSASGRAAG